MSEELGDKMADVFEGVMKRLNPVTLRWALLRSDQYPNGIVARTVRWKIKGMLPDGFANDEVVGVIMKAAIAAAKSDMMWDLIFPHASQFHE